MDGCMCASCDVWEPVTRGETTPEGKYLVTGAAARADILLPPFLPLNGMRSSPSPSLLSLSARILSMKVSLPLSCSVCFRLSADAAGAPDREGCRANKLKRSSYRMKRKRERKQRTTRSSKDRSSCASPTTPFTWPTTSSEARRRPRSQGKASRLRTTAGVSLTAVSSYRVP